MSTESRQPPPDAALDERLVAYLDRELSADESEAIESRLASDAPLRERLSGLDRVWNALDAAPRATTDRGFTESTVSIVAAEAERRVLAETAALPVARRRSRTRVGLAGLFAAVVAFVLVRGVATSGDRRLLSDLPVIQHAGALSQLADVAYLRRVAEEVPAVVEAAAALELRPEADRWGRLADANFSDRAAWLAEQSESRRGEVVERYQAYSAMAPPKADRLRALNDEIRKATDADRLRVAALAHHALLSTQQAADRAAFLSLAEDERLERLRRGARRWTLEAVTRLSNEERRRFRAAVETLAGSDDVSELAERLARRLGTLSQLGPRNTGRLGPRDEPRWRERLTRQAEELGEHPEMLLLGAARRVASPDQFGRRFPNFPLGEELEARWPDWEPRLSSALPDRVQTLLGDESSARRRAQILFALLAESAGPTRPGEYSRYFAEELSSEEQQALLALPVADMQQRLREQMADESLGAPAFEPRGRDRMRQRGSPGERPPRFPPEGRPRGFGLGDGPPRRDGAPPPR